MKIYPLQFEKIYLEKVWGKNKIEKYNYEGEKKIGEILLLSDGNVKSIVKNGELKNKDFTYVMNHYAKNLIGEDKFVFPFTVKYIACDEDLSIQVHPSSKNEIMYFDSPSHMKGGLDKILSKDEIKIDPSILVKHIKKYDLENGDIAYCKAGTLHAVASGSTCFEVSDNCDVTYRLYDYNRGRELDLKHGLESLVTISDLEISHNQSYISKFAMKVENVDGRKIIEEDENFKIIIPLEGKLAIETNTDFFDMDLNEVTLVPYDVTGYSIVGFGKYLDIKPNINI